MLQPCFSPAFGVTTSFSVLTLPGTKAAIQPPQAQRNFVGPSVSAPGWSATPDTLYSRPQLAQRASRSKGFTRYSLLPSPLLRRRNAGTSRSKRLPPPAALALGVLR